MSFANPLFLYGLFALAIPVLIHLFNFRRYTRVWFTNVRFLQELKQETHKRSRLKQWLLLAMRLLAIASVVIAFSRPYIPSGNPALSSNTSQIASIYLDNSFSMDALGEEGTLWDQARAKARDIASGYAPSDQIQLLTNDFDPAHQRLLSPDEFLQALDAVELSPSLRKLSEVLTRQHELLSGSRTENRTIILISDFQQSTCDLEYLQPDSTITYFFLPLPVRNSANLYIDTLFFSSTVQQPDELSKLTIRIRNTGPNRAGNIPVKLMVDGEQRALSNASIDPGSEAEIVVPFRNEKRQWSSGYVEILDYPVVYDDRCYFSYPLISHIPILEIYEEQESQFLQALYETDSSLHLEQKSIHQLDYASLSTYSLIILNQASTLSSGLSQALTRSLQDGKKLLIILPEKPDSLSYRALFSTIGIPVPGIPDTVSSRVASLRLESPLFEDVFEPDPSGEVVIPENADLPEVFLHHSMEGNALTESLITLQNRDPYLLQCSFGKGTLYLLTGPLTLSATTFPKHILFVPVFLRMALLSQSFPRLYYTTGSNQPIESPPAEQFNQELYQIVPVDPPGDVIIPEVTFREGKTWLYPHQQIRNAGLATLTHGRQEVGGLAFNFPREESILAYFPADEIRNQLSNHPRMHVSLLDHSTPSISQEIKNTTQGKPLWKLFLILSLVFLAAEIGIIQFFRNF